MIDVYTRMIETTTVIAWSFLNKALNISDIFPGFSLQATGLSGTQATHTSSEITNTTAIISAHHLNPIL